MGTQRDEEFEKAYHEISKPIIARPYPRNEKGEYFYKEIHEAYLMWRAAKTQTVPEGFILMPKVPTERMVNATRGKHEGAPYLPYSIYESFVEQAMIEAQEQKG